MADEIVIYGSDWCGYTVRTLRRLNDWGVPYRYVNLEENPEEEQRVAAWNNGRAIRPTLDVQGDIFVNPHIETLRGELAKRGLLPNEEQDRGTSG